MSVALSVSEFDLNEKVKTWKQTLSVIHITDEHYRFNLIVDVVGAKGFHLMFDGPLPDIRRLFVNMASLCSTVMNEQAMADTYIGGYDPNA